MALSLIVNAGFIVIPIGATLGVLFGIDASRAAAGQSPMFSIGGGGSSGGGSGGGSSGNNTGGGGDSTGGAGGSSGQIKSNGTITSQYCQLTYGVEPPSMGLNYSFNPNQWGVTDGKSGMCLYVTTFDNETYATNTTAPQWWATWQYTPGPETAPVHAYPNLQVENGLPITIKNITGVDIDMAWAYTIGSNASTAQDIAQFDSISLNTNVAIDMFMDADETKSSNSSAAKYEIMVWFAHFGDAAQTIGNQTGVVETTVINGTTFDLYSGTNSLNQNVFTWVTSETTQQFTGDVSTLITELTSKTGTEYPSDADYLGAFSFGSEAFYADANVTFYVPTFSVDIRT